jgi:hypothetical protein
MHQSISELQKDYVDSGKGRGYGLVSSAPASEAVGHGFESQNRQMFSFELCIQILDQ